MRFDTDGSGCSTLDIIMELIFGIHTVECDESQDND
jgi:hypothetical protein